ncbi:MAG: exodeoxyribonuclease VII small subunit [Lachnospiraceae bacterium]
MAKQETIEEAFEKMDQIIEQLGKGDLSLEESFKLYNDGINLVKKCNTQLDKVEKKIIQLNKEGQDDEI